jgi:hypothetical protein
MVVASKPLFNKYVGTGPQSARLSFQSSELPLLAPSPQAGVASPFGPKGGTHSLAGEGWEEPIQLKGWTLWYSSIIPL